MCAEVLITVDQLLLDRSKIDPIEAKKMNLTVSFFVLRKPYGYSKARLLGKNAQANGKYPRRL